MLGATEVGVKIIPRERVVLIDRMSKGCKMRLWAKGSGVAI
jgi:hypothetical protein